MHIPETQQPEFTKYPLEGHMKRINSEKHNEASSFNDSMNYHFINFSEWTLGVT